MVKLVPEFVPGSVAITSLIERLKSPFRIVRQSVAAQ
jgi:hypothetical protein